MRPVSPLTPALASLTLAALAALCPAAPARAQVAQAAPAASTAAPVADPAPGGGRIVDGVVAAIDQRAIALSTLAAYRLAFAPGEAPADALEAMIDDRLLSREAQRYGQTVPKPELERALARVAGLGGLSRAEWQLLVGDHLLARRFLDFRFGDFVPIPRDQLRAYYDAHRAEYPQPFEQVEERIRARLLPSVRASREADYRRQLRRRADVRVNADLLPRE
jgi:hypothetical protein